MQRKVITHKQEYTAAIWLVLFRVGFFLFLVLFCFGLPVFTCHLNVFTCHLGLAAVMP